jgi:hypothetical protein
MSSPSSSGWGTAVRYSKLLKLAIAILSERPASCASRCLLGIMDPAHPAKRSNIQPGGNGY